MNTRIEHRYDEQSVDLRSTVERLMAKGWWILGSAVVSSVIFIVAAFAIAPVYRASTVLAPASTDRGSGVLNSAIAELGGLASLAGITVGSQGSDTEEALAVLRSRQFTESFIRERELTPKLFAAKWDATRGKWKVAEADVPTPAKAFRRFDKKIRSVVQDKKTGLVTLRIDWTDRNEAAVWANELIRRLNEEMRRRAIKAANASVGFLEKELQSTSTVAIRDAVGRLMEAQVKERMLASVTQEFAFRVVDQATPPDQDDPVRPRRLAMIIAGPIVGLSAAVFWVLASGWWRREAAAQTQREN